MKERFLTRQAEGMLGLCARARKLITGEKAVVQAVRSGACYLALLDGDVAKNGEKAVTQACETCATPLLRAAPGALGDAIGKPGRMAVAVTDAGMARRIIELCEPSAGKPPAER